MSWQYKKRIYSILERVKKCEYGYDLPAFIPVYGDKGIITGWLKPLTENDVTENNTRRLARWRRDNSFAFPSQFRVTVPGTKKWLKNQVIDNPERILFYIYSVTNKRVPIGHLGLASFDFRRNSCEIDNVVRGEKLYHKGLMAMGVRALIKWAQTYLNPKNIYLRVMKDNEHAIKFYRQLGFVTLSADKLNLIKMYYEK